MWWKHADLSPALTEDPAQKIELDLLMVIDVNVTLGFMDYIVKLTSTLVVPLPVLMEGLVYRQHRREHQAQGFPFPHP